MGCRILEGDDGAALYCSTSMVAFGPIFDDGEAAEAFLKWLDGVDPRGFSDQELMTKYSSWLATLPEEP